MDVFIKDDYLLNDAVSKRLFQYAKEMPIIDYHCHLSPKEIYEDVKFNNITEIWLKGDHYKWRLMRSYGIDEAYITGNKDDKEKFLMWAKALSLAIGNPLYEWCHMELKNYFGYEGILDETTAEEVWQIANNKIKDLSAQKLIRESNVKIICTTDDPIDDLEYHRLMRTQDLGFKVLPAWRPDKVLNIEKKDWMDYIKRLEDVSNMPITSYETLLEALHRRFEFFKGNECRVADHGIAHVPCVPYTEEEIKSIVRKRFNEDTLSLNEIEQFKTALLKELHKWYHTNDWVSQLHYGVKRDNRIHLLRYYGVDAGGDSIGDSGSIDQLADFLNLCDQEGFLPKTILYSLNPNDNTAIDTVMGCFQEGPTKSKLQHGSAWWFNDNYDGMYAQLQSLAAQGYLAGFVGMLTDSRSFTSYARHEYFRRVLCVFLADLVNQGRYPNDENKLRKIVEDVSYNNAKEYFGF